MKKLEILQQANPEAMIPRILSANIDELPGSVEFNVARMLGIHINKVREWRQVCDMFNSMMEMLETNKSAAILAKLEEGELAVAVADRLMYANSRENIDPHRTNTNFTAKFDMNNVTSAGVSFLLQSDNKEEE